MNVKQLRKTLEQFDDDAEVVVEMWDSIVTDGTYQAPVERISTDHGRVVILT